jgi:cyclopropane fatty-acyl-phospholipid synthase-like methyltransferase
MKILQEYSSNVGIVAEKDEKVLGYRHGDGIYFDEKTEFHIMHECIAQIIKKSFPQVRSILDVGSGAGSMSYFLRKEGYRVVTLDGNPDTRDSPFVESGDHFVVRTDEDYHLINENGETIKFDMITSFEHFEHIDPLKFDKFMENIKNHCHEGTVCWATAANYRFHNEGEAHIHCKVQPYSMWVTDLNSAGFKIIRRSLFEENLSLLSEHWLPPHGRAAVSYEFVFASK